jgi:hypothetical protein
MADCDDAVSRTAHVQKVLASGSERAWGEPGE